MHPQGRVVGNRVYYGNYNGGPCSSAQNRSKCLLILFSILFLLTGFIITIIGFTLKPFWDESDDWCSFCKEDRLRTLRNTANCRIAGPILLSIGVMLIFCTCCYIKNSKNTTENEGHAQGNITVQFNQQSISNSNTTTTTIHPPPSSTSSQTPSAPATTTQQYPAAYPQPVPMQSPYPPPQAPYLPPQNPTAPYPPQQSPFAPRNEPMMPPPPSYDEVTSNDKRY